ncbi:hypothetical protein D1872_343770 [compost metagenome]
MQFAKKDMIERSVPIDDHRCRQSRHMVGSCDFAGRINHDVKFKAVLGEIFEDGCFGLPHIDENRLYIFIMGLG